MKPATSSSAKIPGPTRRPIRIYTPQATPALPMQTTPIPGYELYCPIWMSSHPATPGGQKVLVSIINPNVDSTVDFRLAIQGTSCYSIGADSPSVLKAAGPLEQNDSEQPDRIRPSAVSVRTRPDGWVVSCAPLSLTVLTLVRNA